MTQKSERLLHNGPEPLERSMQGDRGRQLRAAALISVAVFAGLATLRAVGALQPLELLGYDLALALRSRPTVATEAPIVLVAITEDDIAGLGGWPMSDARLAEVLRTLADQGAGVIGLDVYRDVPVPPGSEALDRALTDLPNVIGIYKFASPGSPGVDPPPPLAHTERIGFSDVVLDAGGVVRRGLAFLDDGDSVGYSLPLRLALAYLAPAGITLRPDPATPSHFMLGETTFAPIEPDHGGYVGADTHGYQFMIDFADLDAGFTRYSVGDVVAGRLGADALRDRVVILGVVAVSVKDAFATPRGQWGWVVDPGMPGIALHAVVTQQLIRAALDGRAPLAAWPEPVEYAVLLGACLVAGLVGLQSRSAKRLLVMAVAGVLAAWGVGYLYFLAGLWVPIVPVATGWAIALALVTAYLVQRERRDRALLQRMFATQTSKEIAETLWERRSELLEEGRFRPQTLPATVLFVDLEGFTGVSERLPPDELMRWVHRFMSVATRVVVAHGGMVDDYFGDGLKANFGAPFPRSTEAEVTADAQAAVQCALALQAEVAQLNANPEGQPRYRARVGIHSGTVLVGGVGNVERQKYTSIGDVVNVAARLEGVGKEFGGDTGSIIVSGATAAHLGHAFELRDRGQVALRGRASPIRVFEVLSRQQEVGNVLQEHGQAHGQAHG